MPHRYIIRFSLRSCNIEASRANPIMVPCIPDKVIVSDTSNENGSDTLCGPKYYRLALACAKRGILGLDVFSGQNFM